MEIQHNAVVGMHYTLKNDDGEVIDSSEGGTPLVFIQGHGNIIHGLESALAGLKVGDSKVVVVEPADGYGEYDDELVQEVPRSAFEGIDTLEVGMQFHADTEDGIVPITVMEISDDVITVDGNHELAGERLHFSVTIDSIREATAEELAHGHIHGDDDDHCHDHGCGCGHGH
ncbi:MAG: peptidylprolyl isomerase [Candidatus Hydrogenedentes bacterium]|nr:peptidylprolyl isomerase [Candidatus Hydrogenedentota bacterium]